MPNAILITGCSQGLGHALALSFANKGLKTYAVGRNNKLMSQLSVLSNNIVPIIADVATENGRSIIFDSVNHDELTYIIHNAAIATPSLITTLTESNLREHFETNFFAPTLLNQKFTSTLKRNLRIMHISSNAADLALPGLMQYCVSKNALEKGTQCFNSELNSKEIYFANLRPGMIDTDMQKKLRESSVTDLPGKNYYHQAKADNTLIQSDIVSKFIAWVMLSTDNLEFSQTLWSINDTKYHSKWLDKNGRK
jgi:benzil reductase ((S)-benzoin forming)